MGMLLRKHESYGKNITKASDVYPVAKSDEKKSDEKKKSTKKADAEEK